MTAKPTIAIAADHGGFFLKQAILTAYAARFDFLDLGTNSEESCNYADYGHALAEAIERGRARQGIIICGSGIGISIAANRHKAVRAALCADVTMARFARLHNDANVLALGARIIGQQVAFDCVDVFFSTAFEGGRHEARVEKLNTGI
ncbi:MAG: ribose 5-phosphate isomerase B [Micavibrio aeruginosavorus]|uniref:Ribose 5-phosphate isomerase B n=1 Tax=Micavibrio aeruginosavorus TaxID=349221 RepID=A0A7T5R0I1_9BACT|nr:MAG: ribose 5-phosphate isomerase B [Micavibrio aeruginosavorus]